MAWISKLSVLALTATLLFSTISVTEQYVFTISDGQLIVPLPTASKVSEVHATPPSAGTYGASQTGSALPPSTTGDVYGVPVLEIYRDGHTCPEGTEASGQRNDGRCAYGNAVSDQKLGSDARCCWVNGQNIFLNAKKGGEKNLGAKYQFDSRTCCDEGTEPTAYSGGKCQYGKSTLAVPGDYLTKCCYSDKNGDFVIHMKQFTPTFVIDDAKVRTSGHAKNGFCNLGYIVDVHQVKLYGDRIEVGLSVNVDCGPYDHWSSTTLPIYLNHNWNNGGRLTYEIDPIFGPTVYVDLSSKVNDDSTVSVHGRITGTGVLGRLEEKFDSKIDDEKVVSLLKALPMC